MPEWLFSSVGLSDWSYSESAAGMSAFWRPMRKCASWIHILEEEKSSVTIKAGLILVTGKYYSIKLQHGHMTTTTKLTTLTLTTAQTVG